MIDVHAHPEGMIFRQHCAERRRDPLRKKNRHARADTEKFNVRNRAQPAQDFFKFVIAKKEGVPAAQEHIANFGMRFKITKRLLEISVQLLFSHSTDDAAASAITA